MMSQATKEYLENMYERDMSNDEIIIRRLDTMIDLTQELLDVMRMILANQNQAYLISGLKKDDETKIDQPLTLSNSEFIKIAQDGLNGATNDLLIHIKSLNQYGANEAIYCALMRLTHIVDNLAKRTHHLC